MVSLLHMISFSRAHNSTVKLVLLVQLAPIGQNIPGEQFLCANTSRDNDSSETTYIITHINVSVAIAGTVRMEILHLKLQTRPVPSRRSSRVRTRIK